MENKYGVFLLFIRNIFLAHLLTMSCKDVVVVFAEIALLGVVDVGNVGSKDRKFLVNGGEVRVGRGCGSVGSIGRVGRVGSRKGSVGRVGAASKEEKDTRKKRRRSKELREPCDEGILELDC